MAKFANKEEYEKWKAGKTEIDSTPADDFPDNDISINPEVKLATKKTKNNKLWLIAGVLLFIVFVGLGISFYLANRPNSALAKYDKKYYWLEEGTSLSGTPINHFDTPTIVEVEYHPDISKNLLFLECGTSNKSASLTLDEFEPLRNNILTREATQDEQFNLKWYKEKLDASEVVFSAIIKGKSVKRWDLADDVFAVFTKDLETGTPGIVRGENEEIMSIQRSYLVDGVEYSFGFRRMENGSDEYCRDCPYRLRAITVHPNKSLTFKEYIKKYWVAEGK